MNKELNIDGKLYRLVEEKPALKVGEWYCFYNSYGIFNEYGDNNVGFGHGSSSGHFWSNTIQFSEDKANEWELADMKEVEKLLIGEAERLGFTDGVKLENLSKVKLPFRLWDKCSDLVDEGGNIIFSFETGKWAEIIEEKKPLYKNTYGTEFYYGDTYSYVDKKTLEVNKRPCLIITSASDDYMDSKSASEIMTERECYLWISQHWDELSK